MEGTRLHLLQDPACLDSARFGNKAAGLARLMAAGYPVPEGFCIPVDADLEAAREEIMAALATVPRPWAVRSSSTSEDSPETAFPGIFDTSLGLVDAELTIEAIRRVRESANSERVREYARRHSIAAGIIKMGVVVQHLLDPEVAGTAFTRNPANGANETVVESTFGLAQPLVSGEITPDRIVVSVDGKVLSTYIGTKALITRAFDGSTNSEETADALRARPSVSNDAAVSIANLARRIESEFGAAQDIEWAIEQERIYILQARPITAFGFRLAAEEAALLDVITSHDDWEYYVTRKFCWLIESTQIEATDEQLHLGTIGFPYPMDRYVIVNGDEYGCRRNDRILYEHMARYEVQHEDFFDRYAVTLRNIAADAREAASQLLQKDLEHLSNHALAAQAEDFARAYTLSFVPTWTRPDTFLEAKVRDAFLPLGPAASSELMYAVARSVDLDSLESSREPVDLLRLNQLYFSDRPIPASVDGLTEAQANALQRHAQRYGWQRAPLGSGLATFVEADYLARLQLAREKGVDPKEAVERIERERRASTNLLWSTVDSLRESTRARKSVETLRMFIYLRTLTTEASDYLFYAGKQKLWAEVCRRLNAALDSVLMCSTREISSCLTGELSWSELEASIAQRRLGFAIVWNSGLPTTVFGRSAHALYSTLLSGRVSNGQSPDSSAVITGQPASPGKARGRVRLVVSGEQSYAMELGDILVTSMTNPDLVLAMEKASAIVTDEGGITCHAAITARELGVPCIIGTGNATSVLPEGIQVMVDANIGTIEILRDVSGG